MTRALGSFTVACVQVNAGNDLDANVAAAGDLIRRARDAGAALIVLPENVSMMANGPKEIRDKAMREREHTALAAFRDLAANVGAWLLIGSLSVKLDEDPDGPVANRSFLVDDVGSIVARYDKIHMFDVDLAGGESYRESKNYRPGAAAVVAPTPFGKIGLTVCYDLRFPHLYRMLAQDGAGILTVPSAFTKVTGEAHWHVLLRARAIETGAYVVAPAQTGTHPGGRKTFGHSLVVAPWGEVVADGGLEPGIVTAVIDPAKSAEARAMVPSLGHDRPFALAPASPRAKVREVN
ncbi:MAG: carbon-nitrogen hydrolase family protein [Alphaproteobacteria bacterium]|nr:carbon-nitrogen hydrolase family protein [Alphaproteobacteria bacterium]